MNDLRGLVDSLLGQAQQMKEHMWLAHGERDMMYHIAFIIEGGEELVSVPDHFVSLGVTLTDSLPELLTSLLTSPFHDSMPSGLPFPGFRLVLTIADGYCRETSPGEGPSDSYDLSGDFASNPLTEVSEALTLTVAVDDLVGGCEVGVGTVRYRITEGGGITFSEPSVWIEGQGGVDQLETGVTEALRGLFEFQAGQR